MGDVEFDVNDKENIPPPGFESVRNIKLDDEIQKCVHCIESDSIFHLLYN